MLAGPIVSVVGSGGQVPSPLISLHERANRGLGEESMAKPKGRHHKLIVSKDKSPAVPVRRGMKLEVVSVSFVDESLKGRRIAATLCGGTSTCVALVETEGDEGP